jgi:hypothetical protein
MSDRPLSHWMTGPEVARALGLSAPTVRRRAEEMGIYSRPWGRARYLRHDVERIAKKQRPKQSQTPATA